VLEDDWVAGDLLRGDGSHPQSTQPDLTKSELPCKVIRKYQQKSLKIEII
jgi:hypothetical protein